MLFGEGPQIKNIAADLNKLFRQGSLLNQIGQTIEGDSTADQGTSDLLAARDPVIQEISVGMSGEQSARYTVSGTPPLSLPKSLGKPLKAWSVDVLPYQEGSGDPAPDNVRPIHGTDKLTITTTGKNLFNPQTVTLNAYVINGSGVVRTGVPNCAASDYIPVMPNTAYRFSPRLSSGNWGAWYDKDKVYISGIVDYSLVHTAPTNARYCRLTVNYNNSNPNYATNFQVEIGLSVTQYEPYQHISQTVLTLPQTVYTGTIGSEGGESRSVMVDMGAQDWIYHSGFDVFYYLTPDGKPTGTGQGGYGMCEAYDVIEGTYYSNLADGQMAVGTNFFSITTATVVVKDRRFTDALQFKAAVAGIKLVYEIADPVHFPLTAPPIPTPSGTATTWATAEDGTVESMEVTYVGKA